MCQVAFIFNCCIIKYHDIITVLFFISFALSAFYIELIALH